MRHIDLTDEEVSEVCEVLDFLGENWQRFNDWREENGVHRCEEEAFEVLMMKLTGRD